MSSQLDLDQGGTFRQKKKVYLGPSVGWVEVPDQTIFPITAPGGYTLLRGMNLVTINVSQGSVVIYLPSSQAAPQGPQAIPNQWALIPIVVVDIGGYGQSNAYQIVPFGSELISGTYSNASPLRITSNYGAYVLNPILTSPGGWSLAQS